MGTRLGGKMLSNSGLGVAVEGGGTGVAAVFPLNGVAVGCLVGAMVGTGVAVRRRVGLGLGTIFVAGLSVEVVVLVGVLEGVGVTVGPVPPTAGWVSAES